jgi:hypothetical protein
MNRTRLRRSIGLRVGLCSGLRAIPTCAPPVDAVRDDVRYLEEHKPRIRARIVRATPRRFRGQGAAWQ